MSRVNNIIKSRRRKELVVKLVCTGIDVAETLDDELSDYIDMHQASVEKMKTLYGLNKVNVSSVHHNVFITYDFNLEKDAKEFEISFIKYIKNDGSNIVESFLITEASVETDEREDFEVFLELPSVGVEALSQFKSIRTVTMEGHPTTPIYQDMLPHQGKKVKLLTKDLDLTIVEIMYFSGKDKIIKSVPQSWLDIKELNYKAIVNTAWVTLPENIIKFSDQGVHAKFMDNEIIVPLEILKMDGKKVTLFKENNKYINVDKEDQFFSPEILIFK